MSVSAMTEMATAIREVVQNYGTNLREVSESDLRDFAMITAAFGADFYRELERRERSL